MKHVNPHHRPGKASSPLDDERSSSPHYSFGGAEQDGQRDADIYQMLRLKNMERAANARMSRPHKTG